MPALDWNEERDHYVYLVSKPDNRWEVRSWFDSGEITFREELKKVGGKIVLLCKCRTTRQVAMDTNEYMNGVRDSLKDRPASPRMAAAMMGGSKDAWGLELSMTITVMLYKGVNNVRGSFWLNSPQWTAEEFKANQCLTTLLCMRAEICKNDKINLVVPSAVLPEFADLYPVQEVAPEQTQVSI